MIHLSTKRDCSTYHGNQLETVVTPLERYTQCPMAAKASPPMIATKKLW